MTISRLENGSLAVTPSVQARIARTLRVPVTELFPLETREPGLSGLQDSRGGEHETG
jgi:transcriptional regulator with XRE-family HTH domain